MAQRILYVNGEVDPWHGLAILHPLHGQPAFMVPGASHHEWTHPPLSTDSKYLIEARHKIFHIVKGWLTHGDSNVFIPNLADME